MLRINHDKLCWTGLGRSYPHFLSMSFLGLCIQFYPLNSQSQRIKIFIIIVFCLKHSLLGFLLLFLFRAIELSTLQSPVLTMSCLSDYDTFFLVEW